MRSAIGNSASDPVFVQGVGAGGVSQPAGTVGDPVFNRDLGSASFATAQAAGSISPAAALQVAPARSGRRTVTLTNITGTQPVYFINNGGTNGVTTGAYIPATAGASITIPTTAAIFATSPTAAQTVSIVETY